MTFVNEQKSDGEWQTIDHEKQIALVVSGPDNEQFYNCKLFYKGQLVLFRAVTREKIHGNPKLGENRQYNMSWRIFQMSIPENIRDEKKEVIGLIHESLKVWGWNYKTEKAHSVSIEISENIQREKA